MLRLVFVTFVALGFVGCSSVDKSSRFRVELVPDQTVDHLLRYADEWGIPQPPEDAELVMLVDATEVTLVGLPDAKSDYPDLDAVPVPSDDEPSGRAPVLDAMGNPIARLKDPAGNTLPGPVSGPSFELGFRDAVAPNLIHLGYSHQIDLTEYGDLVATNRGRIVLDWLRTDFMHGGVAHDYNCALITAVQLLRRDRDSLIGRAVLAQASRADEFSRIATLHVDHPVARLGRAALLNEINQITTPNPDFPRIKTNIERIWNVLGPYTEEVVMGEPRIPKLIAQLDRTVRHPKPTPGSLEEKVERYLFSGGRTFPIMGRHGEGGVADAWEELVLTGFDSIPILIKLLDDDRITNHLMQGFNNFVSHPMRVSQVASSYLQSFAGSDLGEDWLSTQQGYSAKSEIVRKWYEMARQTGERKYVVRHCLMNTESGVHVNRALLLIAERRHPDLLPVFYRRMLRDANYSHPVAESILATPALDQQLKMELFQEGLATGLSAHVRAAERALTKLRGK